MRSITPEGLVKECFEIENYHRERRDFGLKGKAAESLDMNPEIVKMYSAIIVECLAGGRAESSSSPVWTRICKDKRFPEWFGASIDEARWNFRLEKALDSVVELYGGKGSIMVDSVTGRVIGDNVYGDIEVASVDMAEWRAFYDYLPAGMPEQIFVFDVSWTTTAGEKDSPEADVRSSGLEWMQSMALERGDMDQLKRLIARDGGVNAVAANDGATVAHRAAEARDEVALKILRDAGFDMALRDCQGRTPESILAGQDRAKAFRPSAPQGARGKGVGL